MESLTYLKDVKITPKKLRLLLKQVKRMRPVDVLHKLSYMQDRPAQIYHKAIHSALANARQTLKTTDDLLEFKLFIIEEGHALKRYNPGSRGTMKPYKKRFSHIKIILVAKAETKPKNPVKEIEPKPEVKKVAKKASTK